LQSMVQSIASATEQMSSVSGQVTEDIDDIAKNSKETSVCSDIIASASSQLVTVSENLRKIVSQFKSSGGVYPAAPGHKHDNQLSLIS
ncbi:MAG: hypothetical protein HQK92_14530, partial [Nitrospirae bacterium]|nr:hypothetical protein [Nitrospirota bacterium]